MFSTRLAFHAAGLCAATLLLGGVATATGPATASADEDVYSSAHCATSGNHICGPGNDAPAGCYTDGHLDIAWVNYAEPRSDLLWARGYTSEGRYQTCAEIWDQARAQQDATVNVQDFPGGMYVTLAVDGGDVTITCEDGVYECNPVNVARNARLS